MRDEGQYLQDNTGYLASVADNGTLSGSDFDSFSGLQQVGTVDLSVSVVPEPSTFALLAAGLAGLAVAALRRKG